MDKDLCAFDAGCGIESRGLGVFTAVEDIDQKKVADLCLQDVCVNGSKKYVHEDVVDLADKSRRRPEVGNSKDMDAVIDLQAGDCYVPCRGSTTCTSPVRRNAWAKLPPVPFDLIERREDFVNIDKEIVMDDELADEFISQFQSAVVGRILGRRLPIHVLNLELHKRWDKFGKFSVMIMNQDCFLCVFDSTFGRDEMLCNAPWSINGYVMGLDVWSPSFHVDMPPELTSPVWIRLPKLPLMFWDLKNVGRIASGVGKPLWVDGVTSSLSRIDYARVCVQVNLMKPLPTEVCVRSKDQCFQQQVVYEGLPMPCYRCGCVVHKAAACPADPTVPPKSLLLDGSDSHSGCLGGSDVSAQWKVGNKNGVNGSNVGDLPRGGSNSTGTPFGLGEHKQSRRLGARQRQRAKGQGYMNGPSVTPPAEGIMGPWQGQARREDRP